MKPSAIIFDTETTGIDPAVDRLVEIGAVDAHSQFCYETLCNPGRSIPPEAMAVHHITEAQVKDAPDPAEAFRRLLEVFNFPQILIAHNAKFDMGFITDFFPDGYDPMVICTYKCSVAQWPEAPKHSNQVLRYWLGLNPKVPSELAPHRALYDAIVTKEIFRILDSFAGYERLIEISSRPLVLPKVTFGKHKGKDWSEVDYGYLRWVLSQSDMNEDVIHTARYHMNKRYSGAR